MRRLMQRGGVFLASLLLLVGGGFLAASPAQAVTCYGDYCSNKDPQATGCAAGAWTQHAIDVYFYRYIWSPTKDYAGRLELRGSNTCGSTQWGRFTPVNGGFSYRIRAEQPETGYVTDWQHANEWQTAWTNQIYSPTKCVRIRMDVFASTAETVYTHCI